MKFLETDKAVSLSSQEAWRLYNNDLNVIELIGRKSLSYKILEKKMTFSEFMLPNKRWALFLEKEESQKIFDSQKWRMILLFLIIFSSMFGLLSFESVFWGVNKEMSEKNFFIGSFCFLLASFSIIKINESFNNEKKLWNKVFLKYDIPS